MSSFTIIKFLVIELAFLSFCKSYSKSMPNRWHDWMYFSTLQVYWDEICYKKIKIREKQEVGKAQTDWKTAKRKKYIT